MVFHCASVAPSAEDATNKALAHAVNVLGTQHVITACVQQRVPKLVFTSSASVVFDGSDLLNVDESAPYAKKALDYYTCTKVTTPFSSFKQAGSFACRLVDCPPG